MKLATYLDSDQGYHLGTVNDGTMVNLHHASNGELPDDMLGFLAMGEHAMDVAREAVESAGAGMPMDSVTYSLSRLPSQIGFKENLLMSSAKDIATSKLCVTTNIPPCFQMSIDK